MAADFSIVTCPECGRRNRVGHAAHGRPRCGQCTGDLPWVVDADDETFASAVDTTLLTLVDLWVPWCGPCRLVAPVLERLAIEYSARLKVVKVNVDDCPQVASKFQATSIPMLVFLDQKRVVDTVVGAQPERTLRQHIDRLLSNIDKPTTH